MIIEDQTAVIDFLAAPSTHGGATVEQIDTHASVVFLAGRRAYKLKRAVRFDYLDFSTSERRRTLCQAEVRLNRRTAPTLYRGVVAVTRQNDGTYALGGNGRPVDWLVEIAVRAKTSATAAQLQHDAQRRSELEGMAREYLAMGEQLLHPPHPCLVAVGGFSGSGKSTLALSFAPSVGAVPGAIVVRSDETRKRLCGVLLLHHLGAEGYSSHVSERVYSTLQNRPHESSVQATASSSMRSMTARADRRVIEHVAEAASVPFIGLWLEAPESLLIDRTAHRRNDASDADATVVRMQRARDIGHISWYRLDASVPAASVLSSAMDRVRDRLHAALNVPLIRLGDNRGDTTA